MEKFLTLGFINKTYLIWWKNKNLYIGDIFYVSSLLSVNLDEILQLAIYQPIVYHTFYTNSKHLVDMFV